MRREAVGDRFSALSPRAAGCRCPQDYRRTRTTSRTSKPARTPPATARTPATPRSTPGAVGQQLSSDSPLGGWRTLPPNGQLWTAFFPLARTDAQDDAAGDPTAIQPPMGVGGAG